MKIRFRLRRYRYAIVCKWHYCGGYANCLRPRPGEDWIRGSDLRDGPLWGLPAVLWDVLCYEFNWGRWGHRRPNAGTEARVTPSPPVTVGGWIERSLTCQEPMTKKTR